MYLKKVVYMLAKMILRSAALCAALSFPFWMSFVPSVEASAVTPVYPETILCPVPDSFTGMNKTDRSRIGEALAKTKTAEKTDQIILVIGHSLSLWNKGKDGSWTSDSDVETYCGLGKNGLSSSRHEGDSTTPVGSYPVLYGFGRKSNPGTKLEYRKVTPHSYVSGERDETYNTWVESSKPLSDDSEHLIDYYQYDYAMNFGFNLDPTVVGKGSAIFVHCKSNDHWTTAGCIGIPKPLMIDLLKKSHKGEYILIVPTEKELANY